MGIIIFYRNFYFSDPIANCLQSEITILKVTYFQDKAGKFVNKHPNFMIGLGNRESAALADQIENIAIKKPIFITGLARSGTTIILEKLAAHKDLVSYRYKDFPLVHIPYWWEKFLNRAGSGKLEPTERAHKDRIKISPDSPEAIDEILWMSFFDNIHSTAESNIIDNIANNEQFSDFYQKTIKKVLLARNGKRYLSKNNYNISRVKLLTKIFPDAKIVIAVRAPAATIASLIKQHKLFCEVERENPKILTYMQNLGHFEFGIDRRPINFSNSEQTLEIVKLLADENILGYVKYWNTIYSYVNDLLADKELKNNLLLVNYDSFCSNPHTILKKLYEFCELDVEGSVLTEQSKTISAPTYYKPEFSDEEISIIEEKTKNVSDRLEKSSE